MSMKYSEYLREEAAKYRGLAMESDDPAVRQELLDLATTCEEAADRVDESQTAG